MTIGPGTCMRVCHALYLLPNVRQPQQVQVPQVHNEQRCRNKQTLANCLREGFGISAETFDKMLKRVTSFGLGVEVPVFDNWCLMFLQVSTDRIGIPPVSYGQSPLLWHGQFQSNSLFFFPNTYFRIPKAYSAGKRRKKSTSPV